MQITRQRVRPVTSVETLDQCPVCHGTGKAEAAVLVIDKIEDMIAGVVNERGVKCITLKLHPFIAAYIKRGLNSLRLRWSLRYKVWISVVEVPSYYIYEYHLFDKKRTELK